MAPNPSTPTRLLRQDPRAQRLLFLAVGAGFVAGALLAIQAWLLSLVVDRVFLRDSNLLNVLPLLELMVALLLARSALIWGSDVLAQRSASCVKHNLRQKLSDRLLAQGPTRFSAPGKHTGELVYTTVEGVEALDAYVTQFLPARYLAALVPAFVFLLVLALDPPTTLVLLFAGPMLLLMLALIGGRARAITQRRFLELSWMSAFYLDVLQGIATLKMFGRSREQAANIEEISQHYGKTTMEVLATAFQSSLVMEWAATAATALVALEVSLRLMNGVLPFSHALAVLLLTPEFFLPLRTMAMRYHAGTAGEAAASRVLDMLGDKGATDESANQRTSEPADGQTGDQAPAGGARREWANGRTWIRGYSPTGMAAKAKVVPKEERPENELLELPQEDREGTTREDALPAGDICFHEVSYAYDDGQRPALQRFSLALPRGQTTALVGPTGAGKTTVTNLLLRFIEPQAGSITLDGEPLSVIEPAAWRACVGWVPQLPHLFHGSVADNIRLARPDAGMGEVIAVAKAANADEFIQALPQGYDTPLGERGARLSGGQQQRIAIARAFLKDAPFLILDEATAHLDCVNEALIQDALQRLMTGRTVLIIAHHLRLAYAADQVVVVEQGRVIQSGTHDTLMGQDGLYRRLVTAYQS